MEPERSFHHAALKVEWASILLNNLRRDVNRWIETKPYSVWVDFDPEANVSRIKSGITKPIPATINLLAGDICGNLRSALDCAWMGLVRAEGTEAKHTLPIASNRKGVESMVGNSPVKAAAGDAVILLRDELGAHQDWENGGSRALSALNELNNWQKHNLLLTTPVAVFGGPIIISTTLCKNISIGQNITVSLGEQGLAKLSGEPVEVRHEGETTGDIMIKGVKFLSPEPIVPTLLNFVEFTREAVIAFVRHFPAGDSPETQASLAKRW